MKKRQAIRDAARVFGLSFDESTKLINSIPEDTFANKKA